MSKTSVHISQDHLDDLDALSKARGMNRSQVIRQAIKKHIEEARNKGDLK